MGQGRAGRGARSLPSPLQGILAWQAVGSWRGGGRQRNTLEGAQEGGREGGRQISRHEAAAQMEGKRLCRPFSLLPFLVLMRLSSEV